MPSSEHDILNWFFRDKPELAVELLRNQLDVELPCDIPAYVTANDFNDRPSKDEQADTVILLGPMHDTRRGIIVEIQRDPNDDKRKKFARYAAALWLRLDCPVTTLVICPDRKVAASMAVPYVAELDSYTSSPYVLGPDRIPVLTNPAEVKARPELAAMSVMAHGDLRPVREVFIEGLKDLEPDNGALCYDYAYKLASPIAKDPLEALMKANLDSLPFSPTFRRQRELGREEGREVGREEGREEGREVGKAEGEAKALLTVLDARGIAVPEPVLARITACGDPEQLNAWVGRAGTATRIEDVFGEDD